MKNDLLNRYFRGDIDLETLKNSTKKKIATKKELEDFLSNSFLQGIMSTEHGIPKEQLKTKVKELLDNRMYETTTTGNTGDVSHSVHGWENDPERKKKLVQMLKTSSVADVVKQLTKSSS